MKRINFILGVFFVGCLLGTGVLSAGTESAIKSSAKPDNGLAILMEKHSISHTTAQVTPTVCALAGIQAPETAIALPIRDVTDFWSNLKKKDGKPAEDVIEKALIFCPDATGNFLVPIYPDDWKPLFDSSDVVVKGTNVLPSVTPVCFGAIFTGAPPEIHGIRKYQDKYLPNPIKVKTLFDAFAEDGKKVIIISQKNCSIDLIFRNRPIDYISVKTSKEAVETTKKLLNEYDLIICYDGNYDSVMHGKGVHHPKSIDAMRDSIRWYFELVEAADSVWAEKNRLTAFIPDHGAHDTKEGKGTHGTSMADDAIVNHFYRLRSGK
ncbi:MAG: hypothetical protein Q4D17_07385 [Planctomycetia bacterium]|nr:hypothetical protein [Planctomycetia bacterium]